MQRGGRQFFKVEYILIFISLLACFLSLYTKEKTKVKFEELNNNLDSLQMYRREGGNRKL